MPMTTTATLRTRIATWRERWLAGLTRKGLALVALICLLNALRRSGDTPYFPLDHWLLRSGEAFGTGLIVLLLMTVAIVATYNRAASTPRFRYAALALAIVISSAVGTAILFAVESRGTFVLQQHWGGLARSVVGTWPRYALIGLLLAAVFVYLRGAEESEATTHQAELDRARLDQQMEEARLQVLQTQIEPHFLFNTLATVRRLYQTQPAAGESMLENLMRYLAVALPQMRAADSTLGRETTLAEAYLGIQQIRMGRRLAFAIDVPDALHEAKLPPMMLLTLTENAIKHGLDPLPEGGFIRVAAQVEGRGDAARTVQLDAKLGSRAIEGGKAGANVGQARATSRSLGEAPPRIGDLQAKLAVHRPALHDRRAGGGSDMSSVGSAQLASPPIRLTARAVLDAWRGITRFQIMAALLLGALIFLYHLLVSEGFGFQPHMLIGDFVAIQIRAFTLMLCVVVADHVTAGDAHRRAAYALAVLISTALATPITAIVWAGMLGPEFGDTRWPAASTNHGIFEWLILSGMVTFVYTDQRRARAARARMHAAELERAHTAKRLLESRLQAMQARVEPQFLFNTLAQVRDLYRANAARGERMLDELIAYLRAAMPKMRDTSSTVGQEIELVRAYLGIVRQRLGERLAFDIETPEQVADVRMPPMMLLPLIDHALVHSLAASQAAGSIRIRTGIADGKVRLEIADSGAGFLPENEGDGIAGIRERLAALYEAQASLVLQKRVGSATVAVLELPCEQAAQPADAAVAIDASPSSSCARQPVGTRA